MFDQLESRRFLSAAIHVGIPQVPTTTAEQGTVYQDRQRDSVAANARPGIGSTLSPLSAAEAADLKAIARDEKLARDVYNALYAEWGNVAFRNIAASEQQHLSAVSSLLAKYKVANPVAALPAGQFDTAAVQTLYNQLVAQGRQSLAAALHVGVQIEELDINDLTTAISHTSHADIRNVYSSLLQGSRNHLAAFNLQLDRLDALA